MKPDRFSQIMQTRPHACPFFFLLSLSVGSYFALQWLANLLITATALGQNCTLSNTANTVLWLINLLASFGLSVIGTNLLCHRYLIEKARVMIKMYGALMDSSSIYQIVSALILTS
jgi:hypothetical protein